MRCNIKNNSDFDISNIEDLVQDLFSHANQVLDFQNAPTIVFLSEPTNYGVLKKTAQYSPDDFTITIYVDGRHAKDILRSMAHELVHHHQNERGDLSNQGDTGDGYAQSNNHMRGMEDEAYRIGNLDVFRDWEDRVKERHPTIYNERRIQKMSIKDWKDKELNRLLMEKWGFGKKEDTSVKEEKKLLTEDKK
jgi:hypothetical protein